MSLKFYREMTSHKSLDQLIQLCHYSFLTEVFTK